MPVETPTARRSRPLRAARTRALVVALAAFMALSASPAWADAPSFAGASANADTVFFVSAEKLVPGDTDLKEDVYQRSFDPGLGIYVTREISTGPTGGNGAFDASFRGASEDGKTVFFSTDESLVGADKDQARDVYARLGSGATVLVSQPDPSCTGTCGNGNAAASFLGASVDGNRVFFSTDEQLTSADTDASFDIYERTLSPGATELVSRAAADCVGACGNGIKASIFEGVSADGNKVAFSTNESLAPEDGDQLEDVYQRDLSGETALVSTPGNCPGSRQCDAVYRGASNSGGRIFFQTSEQIGVGDNDEEADVYAWSGTNASLVSRADPSCVGPCGQGEQPTTYVGSSQDGGRVFLTTSEALTAADPDTAVDIYVRDLGSGTGTTELVSASGTCVAGLDCNAAYQGSSADGNLIFFQSGERAAPGDVDSATDVFVRDLGLGSTALVSAAAAGCAPGCGNGPADARFAGSTLDGKVAFFTTGESLSPADGDKSSDVYARDLAGEPSATELVSPRGICPLSGEAGCDVTLDATSEDGTTVVFSTVKRLTAEDVDSTSDIYQLSGGTLRLVSIGNSVEIGPATPILTGTNPASPNPSTKPGLLGHAGSGTAIKIYATQDCTGAPIATGSVEEFEGSGVAVEVEPGSTTAFRATATDESGDASACSPTAVPYTQAAEGAGGGGGGQVTAPAVSPAGSTDATVTKSGRTPTGVGGRREVPLTRITFAPASRTLSRRPVLRFTDSTEQSGTTFLCKVDRQAWRGCSSPLRLKHLSLGSHSFRVKGSNSGLVEPVPAIRKFKVVER
ncbi:MAG: hypothetical protein JWM24_817 [Solirubrobacterales bacterium]|nr:hypothetical protein [Solirubrobacterales bacterium]